MHDDHDPFEAAYHAGVTRALAPAQPGEVSRPLRAAPARLTALEGCVVTPDRVLDPGYVLVGDGHEIQAVEDAAPANAEVFATSGVICPGLIDLHGHPEFNVFAAWDPPREFDNRYIWRQDPLYQQLVRGPQNTLKTALPAQTQLRYAEIRALVGGVTAIQGTSEAVTHLEAEALVRNVDKLICGQHRARAMIALPTSKSGRNWDQLQGILAGIDAGEVDAFYIHLAEGKRDNERSQNEFDRLVEFGALREQTVIIHGTALTGEQFGQLQAAGAKLVWSPQSNLRLYGQTTCAADALEQGVLVGLGADWLPSGSTSLLAEMTVARRVLAEQKRPVEAKKLVEMVTTDAATIAGLADHLGSLDARRPADLVVFERRVEDAYENIAQAEASWVELVMIDDDVLYGRADWMQELTPQDEFDGTEPLIAWGKPMRLDTRYAVHPADVPPTLAQLRQELIAHYPPVGPIFA